MTLEEAIAEAIAEIKKLTAERDKLIGDRRSEEHTSELQSH